MSIVSVKFIIAMLLLALPQDRLPIMHITTSDAIDLARIIARNEGYDIRNTRVYYFDLLITPDGKPFLPGYTTIGFYINGNPGNTIAISNATGQTIDYDTCEIFDYPEVRPFQEQMMRLSKAPKKTPQELANDAGCSSPKVLNKPTVHEKK